MICVKMGQSETVFCESICVLTAQSDDSNSVVVKVSEAIGSSQYEFHFPIEAFRDGVVFLRSATSERWA